MKASSSATISSTSIMESSSSSTTIVVVVGRVAVIIIILTHPNVYLQNVVDRSISNGFGSKLAQKKGLDLLFLIVISKRCCRKRVDRCDSISTTIFENIDLTF